MISRCSVLLAGAAVAFAAGCAEPYYLHSRLTDQVFRERAAPEFTPGMTPAEVEARLDELRQDADLRLWYEPTPAHGSTLLARFFPPGGAWIRGEDVLLEYIDLAFEFEAAGDGERLENLWMYRDKVRYFQGGVAYGPRRPAMGPARRWPGTIPPPVDPYQDAWRVWATPAE